MVESRELRRYLIIFSLNPATPQRLKEFVPEAQNLLHRLSAGSMELAFRSTNADTFGWVIQCARNAKAICNLLQNPTDVPHGAQPLGTPFLTNADDLLVLEIGTDLTATQGFSRVHTWFQRHGGG